MRYNACQKYGGIRNMKGVKARGDEWPGTSGRGGRGAHRRSSTGTNAVTDKKKTDRL